MQIDIEKAKRLAERNVELFEAGKDEEIEHYFVYEGQMIHNPFISECGRFDVDPVEHYGDYFIYSNFVVEGVGTMEWKYQFIEKLEEMIRKAESDHKESMESGRLSQLGAIDPSQIHGIMMNAKEVVVEYPPGCPVSTAVGRISISRYLGSRDDRMRSRNAITNKLGFPEVRGRSFLSFDDLEGIGGTFLADTIVDCLKWDGRITADGVRVEIPTDWEHKSGYMSYSPSDAGRMARERNLSWPDRKANR